MQTAIDTLGEGSSSLLDETAVNDLNHGYGVDVRPILGSGLEARIRDLISETDNFRSVPFYKAFILLCALLLAAALLFWHQPLTFGIRVQGMA